MEKNEEMKKQYEILAVFFANYYDKVGGPFGYWLATGVMVFFAGIFMAIPFQEMIQEELVLLWMALLPCVATALLYALPYKNYMEGGILKGTIEKKLMYMPIDTSVFQYFRMCKLIKFQLKVYVALQVIQLLFSLIFFRSVVFGNFWYPFLWVLVIPVVVVAIMSGEGFKWYKTLSVLLVLAVVVLFIMSHLPVKTTIMHSIEGIQLAEEEGKTGEPVLVTIEGTYENKHGSVMRGSIFQRNAFEEGVIYMEDTDVIVFPATEDKQARELMEDMLLELNLW